MPEAQIIVAEDESAHTASVAAAFHRAASRSRPGGRVLHVTAGAGITAGAALYRLPALNVDRPNVQTTEGVWIDAPASAVWPWLVQMGQDRGGLYSYQTLENFVGLDYHNADRIHPEWQHLAPGDVMRLAPKGWFGLRDGIVTTVVDVTEQQSIVLRMTPPEHLLDAVWSFHLIPHWEDRCRL